MNIAKRVDHIASPIHSFLFLSKYGKPTFPKMWHTKLSFVPVRGSTRDSSVDLHAIEAAWGASNLISARGRAAVVRVERTRRGVHAHVRDPVVRLVPAGQHEALRVLACGNQPVSWVMGRPEFDFHTGSHSRSSPICCRHRWLLTVTPLGRTWLIWPASVATACVRTVVSARRRRPDATGARAAAAHE